MVGVKSLIYFDICKNVWFRFLIDIKYIFVCIYKCFFILNNIFKNCVFIVFLYILKFCVLNVIFDVWICK